MSVQGLEDVRIRSTAWVLIPIIKKRRSADIPEEKNCKCGT